MTSEDLGVRSAARAVLITAMKCKILNEMPL